MSKKTTSNNKLGDEDKLWESAMQRHEDKFTELKAKAKADADAGKAIATYDENGEFILNEDYRLTIPT